MLRGGKGTTESLISIPLEREGPLQSRARTPEPSFRISNITANTTAGCQLRSGQSLYLCAVPLEMGMITDWAQSAETRDGTKLQESELE